MAAASRRPADENGTLPVDSYSPVSCADGQCGFVSPFVLHRLFERDAQGAAVRVAIEQRLGREENKPAARRRRAAAARIVLVAIEGIPPAGGEGRSGRLGCRFARRRAYEHTHLVPPRARDPGAAGGTARLGDRSPGPGDPGG